MRVDRKPGNQISDEDLDEALRLYAEFGTERKAAKAAGIPYSTFHNILVKAKIRGPRPEYPKEVIDPDPEIPIEEIVGRLTDDYTRRKQAHKSKKWFRIKIKEKKPYGVAFIGDIHIGDGGCNMPLLIHHQKLFWERNYIYPVMTGDLTNRWIGKLMFKYAHQETSRTTEERLVEEWVLPKFRWLVWILGNHDRFADGLALFKRMAKGVVPVLDEQAQFILEHAETEARIDVRHSRPGHSMWNELHATLKASKLGERAHIYSTSHTHDFGYGITELSDGWISHLLQLRGYKTMDTYALHRGFKEFEHGSSMLAIIDPERDDPVISVWQDIEEGCRYLDFLRS